MCYRHPVEGERSQDYRTTSSYWRIQKDTGTGTSPYDSYLIFESYWLVRSWLVNSYTPFSLPQPFSLSLCMHLPVMFACEQARGDLHRVKIASVPLLLVSRERRRGVAL